MSDELKISELRYGDRVTAHVRVTGKVTQVFNGGQSAYVTNEHGTLVRLDDGKVTSLTRVKPPLPDLPIPARLEDSQDRVWTNPDGGALWFASGRSLTIVSVRAAFGPLRGMGRSSGEIKTVNAHIGAAS